MGQGGRFISSRRRSSYRRQGRRSRRHLFELLEDRRLLAVTAPPSHPLSVSGPAIYLASVNADAEQNKDLVSVDARGTVDLFLNSGDNKWLQPSSHRLVEEPVLSAATMLLDGDPFEDLILLTDDGLSAFLANSEAGWLPHQQLSIPEVTDGTGMVIPRIGVGHVDTDLSSDVVIPLPQSGQVAVFAGGADRLREPQLFESGGQQPISVAVLDVVGDAATDVVVGHTDGSITFLQGTGEGDEMLVPRPELTLSLGIGAVHSIEPLSASVEPALVVAGSDGVVVVAGGDPPLDDPFIVNGDFGRGLTGWQATAEGTPLNGSPGRVTAASGFVRQSENEAFITSLSQTITIPGDATSLRFDLLSLGLDPAVDAAIPDAWEISLLNDSGESLVATHAPHATSFANFSSTEAPSLAPGVAFDGLTVSLDVTALQPGAQATLWFDLIGNPEDDGSTVQFDDVRFHPPRERRTTFEIVPLEGLFDSTHDLTVNDVDGDGFADIVVSDAGLQSLLIFNGSSGGEFVRSEISFEDRGAPSLVAADNFASFDESADLAVSLSTASTLFTPLPLAVTAADATLVDPAEGSLLVLDAQQDANTVLGTLTLRFTEAMRAASPAQEGSVTNPNAYRLYNLGRNGIDEGGSGDDQLFPITKADYDPQTYEVVLTVDPGLLSEPALAAGSSYRLAVNAHDSVIGVRDLSGNRLAGGEDFIATFGLQRTPLLDALADVSVAEGGEVNVTTRLTHYNLDATYAWEIDWGDGSSTSLADDDLFPVQDVSAEHRYADDGDYTVVVTVRDTDGSSTETTGSVRVANVAPEIDAVEDVSAAAGEMSIYAVSGRDPGRDDEIYASFDWGDGSQSELVARRDGDQFFVEAEHAYDQIGTYQATLTVADDAGDIATAGFAVHVTTTPSCGGGAIRRIIDFDADAEGAPLSAGELVHDQWSDWDVRISSHRPLRFPSMIFDSSRPTGGDTDLGTPNLEFGGPGIGSGGGSDSPAANEVPLGNVLIVSEDGNREEPDDRAAGGTLEFTFVSGVFVEQISFLDIDQNEVVHVRSFDQSGSELVYVEVPGVGGGNGVQHAVLGAAGVHRLEIDMSGSVAVTRLSFCQPLEADTPDGDPSDDPDPADPDDDPDDDPDRGEDGGDAGEHEDKDDAGGGRDEGGSHDPERDCDDGQDDEGNGGFRKRAGGHEDGSKDRKGGEGDRDKDHDRDKDCDHDREDRQSHRSQRDGKNTSRDQDYHPDGQRPADDKRDPEDASSAALRESGEAVTRLSTRFFIPDAQRSIFRYATDGSDAGHFDSVSRLNPRGAATVLDGNPLWLVSEENAVERVYVYDTDGEHLLGSWVAAGLTSPEGIATDGADIWIVDGKTGEVSRYLDGAFRRSGRQRAADRFSLTYGNASPRGITSDGSSIWIVDDESDRIFVYSVNGTFLNWWTLDPENRDPAGVTINPGGDGIWVVDAVDREVYEYPRRVLDHLGAQTAVRRFSLSQDNLNPTGIADPATILAYGELVTGDIASVGEVDEYAFTATAGDLLNLDFVSVSGGPLTSDLYAPDGALVDTRTGYSQANHDRLGMDIGATGDHIIRISGSGSYSFRLSSVPEPQTFVYTLGEVTSASLDTIGGSHRYVFTGSAEDEVFLDWRALAGGGASVRLLSEEGELIADASGLSANNLDLKWQILPADGQYTLEITSTASNALTYSFVLSSAPTRTFTTDLDAVIQQTIAGPGGRDVWRFDVEAGETYFFDMQDIAPGSLRTRLVAPDGSIVFDRLDQVENSHDRGPKTFEQTGEYRLEVQDDTGGTPAYRMRLWSVPDPEQKRLRLGEVMHGSIETPGRSDEFTFAAQAGRQLFLDVQEIRSAISGIETIVSELVAPNGTSLFRNTDFIASTHDFGPIMLPVDGEYTLRFSGDGDDVANFQFRLDDVTPDVPVRIEQEQVVTGAIDVGGRLHRYTFDADAGQQLTLDVIFNRGFAPVSPSSLGFTLLDPSGNAFVRDASSDRDLVVQTSGLHTIFVDDRNSFHTDDDTGRFSFRITSDPLTQLPASADLRVSNVTANRVVTADPASVTVSWTVTNVGDARADGWLDQIIFSPDETAGGLRSRKLIDTSNAVALGPGESYVGTADVSLPAGLDGEFWLYVESDPSNSVYENQGELDNHSRAAEPTYVHAQTRTGGAPTLSLRPQNGSRFVAGDTVALTGSAVASGASTNAIFVIDVSASTLEPNGLDVNLDGAVNAEDDVNNYPETGDVLDAEIAATLRLIEGMVRQTNDLRVATVMFAGTSEPVDLGPGLMNQLFVDPSLVTYEGDQNTLPNHEYALRALWSFSTGFSARQGAFYFRNTEVLDGTLFEPPLRDVERLLDAAPPAERTLVYLLTDGVALDAQPVNVSGVADRGVDFFAFQIGNDQITPELAELAAAINADPASTATAVAVADPEELAPQLLNTLDVATVTVDGEPVVAIDPAGRFFSPVTIAPGENRFVVTATGSSGRRTSRTLTLFGDRPDDPINTVNLNAAPNLLVPQFSGTTFNRATSELHVKLHAANRSEDSVQAPLVAIAESFAPSPAVSATNPDLILNNEAAWVFDTEVADGVLRPGESSGSVDLTLANPLHERFKPVLRFRTRSETATAFASTPPLIADPGTEYHYPASVTGDGQVVFSLREAPRGMTVDAQTGRISWRPSTVDGGHHSVRILADNGRGLTAEQQYTLLVRSPLENNAPLIVSQPPEAVATVGQLYNYPISAVDPDGESVLLFLADDAPDGARLENNELRWTPDASQVGEFKIPIRAADPQGALGTQDYVLQVLPENSPPSFLTDPDTLVLAGDRYRYQPLVLDQDDAVRFALETGPDRMSIDARTGLVTWRPDPGDFGSTVPVKVRAVDSRGQFAEQSFVLLVTSDDQPPELALHLSASNVDEGQPVEVTVFARDRVAVQEVTLSLNGVPLTLDETRQAVVDSASPGFHFLTARAVDPSGNRAVVTERFAVRDPADQTPPSVKLHAPLDRSSLTYLTDVVASVDDDNLASYSLEYSPLHQESWTPISQVDRESPAALGVIEEVIGVLDPTLLRNDQYEIRLTARDLNGNTASDTVVVALDGNAKIGVNDQPIIDLTIPVAGGPGIQITRRHSQLTADRSGDFGSGWEFCAAEPDIRESVARTPFESLLGQFAALPFREGDKVYLTTPDCQRVGFTFHPVPHTGIWTVLDDRFFDPRWVPDPGVEWRLFGEYDYTSPTGLSGGEFDLNGLPLPLLRFQEDHYIIASVNASYNPLGYQLVDKQGVRYHYDQDGGLLTVTDRNGNQLAYGDDQIVSSSGQSVRFQRDSQERITKVIDPAGREIDYSYDAAGNLVHVSYPEELSNSYRYTAENYLAAVNPEALPEQESTAMGFEYDVAGRLATVLDAYGATNSFTYDLEGNRRITYDALGYPTETTYDDRGNMTSETSANGDTASYEYDGDDNLTKIRDERGFETLMTYDARRNLTSVTDALGNETLFSYNDANDLTQIVDAAGGVHRYDLDEAGNQVRVLAPGGTTTTLQYDTYGRVVRVTDVDGHVRELAYADGPHPTRYVERDGTSVNMTYDVYGHLTSFTDARGHTLTVAMDDRQRPVAETDALGNSTRFEYAGSRVQRLTDPMGYTTRYVRDRNDRPIQIIDAEGGVIRIDYDGNGRRKTVTDANDNETHYAYRPDGRLLTVTDALGGVTTYEYDEAGNRTARTDANGHRWQWEYDALGYTTASTTPAGERTEFEYDAMGNLIREKDPLGRVTTYEYGPLQLPIRIVDAAGGEIELEYDWQGNLTAERDQNGRRTTFSYDRRNRLTSVTDAMLNVVRYEYDDADNLTAIIDQRGNVSRSSFDAANRLVRYQDATGAVTSYGHDANGRLVEVIDADGGIRSLTYDKLGRRIQAMSPRGGTLTWSYDAVGNLIKSEDELSRATVNRYDKLNRRVSVVDAVGATTSFSYDAVGNLLTIEDPESNVTGFEYDKVDRLVSVRDPLGAYSYTEYDSVGNTVAQTDRNGRKRTYEYDALDRVIFERWWDESRLVNSLSFAYDGVGNLLDARDQSTALSFSYDALNRLVSADNLGSGSSPHVVLHHRYDAAGNRTHTSDLSGAAVDSVYDPRDLLSVRTWQGGGVSPASVRYEYDGRGFPIELQRFASIDATALVSSTSQQFDLDGRTSAILHANSIGDPLVSYAYTRDLAGQLTEERHHGRAWEYRRDNLGQLLEVTVDAIVTENYQYDLHGNRTGESLQVGAGNRLTEDANFHYQYDAEGNLVFRSRKSTGASTRYQYDHRNRLTAAEDYDAAGRLINRVTYIYDALDRQVSRSHDPDGDGPLAAVQRYTVYDGPHPWADYDQSGMVTARYLFGDRVDEIVARWREDEGTVWYLTDHLGTVRDLIDASGQIIDTIDYDSFGRIVARSNPGAADRFTFTGREWDDALGFYYYRARFYDPATGRFISEDPIGFVAGDTNLYRYVGNNPLDFVDPSGNLAITECEFVRYASAAVNVVCPALQTALNESFESEGLSPEARLSRTVEQAFYLLNVSSSALPFGSAFAFQMVMGAVTIATTSRAIANELANSHLFNIMGLGETYVREAYRYYEQGAYATFEQAFASFSRSATKPLFWSEIVCGAANIALMVYSARARCFVAGTPIVVGIQPHPMAVGRASSEGETAENLAAFQITTFDVLACIATAGGIAAMRGRRRVSAARRQIDSDERVPEQSRANLVDAVFAIHQKCEGGF